MRCESKDVSAMSRLEVTIRAHVALLRPSGSLSGRSSLLFPEEDTRKDDIPRRLCARESVKISRGVGFGRLWRRKKVMENGHGFKWGGADGRSRDGCLKPIIIKASRISSRYVVPIIAFGLWK